MARRNAFFAIRIVVRDETGSTYTRDYVRGQMRVGKQAFLAYALGDMFLMLELDNVPTTFEWQEIDFETVRQNRLYNHTSH